MKKETMLTKKVSHMNTGNGEFSYASNSYVQETGIKRSLAVLNEAINKIANDLNGFPECIKIADLGCSSGPTALSAVTNIIDSVHGVCSQSNTQVPQFQVFLNDQFENDFNAIFKSMPAFYKKMKDEKGDTCSLCFVSAVPGSFHGRLFPSESIHFFHSSYALHWLSRVPLGVENNKLNIYMAKTSPTNIFEAYKKQFEIDFTNFLQLRSQEIKTSGHMILTMAGRGIADPRSEDCCIIWELLAKSLVDMVKEGLIQQYEIASFNIPCYTPFEDEVKEFVQKEGSFSLHSLDGFPHEWEPYNTDKMDTNVTDLPIHGIKTAKAIRAIIEPLMETHFGNSKMDMVFKKFEEHVVNHIATKKVMNYNLIMSLIKR